MEIEKQVHLVDDIRDELTNRIDTRLRVRANLGRSKISESVGFIRQAHPSLFIMEVDPKRGRQNRSSRQSFQYVDVLTGTVELFDPETGSPIFDVFVVDDGNPFEVDMDSEELDED